MTQQEWMREGMDFRLCFLLFLRKIWLIALAGIAGALLAGGCYFAGHVIYAPARQYEAVSRYYITFADDLGKDYYNDYTWNDLAASDPILDYTMSLLPGEYDREAVQQSVTAKIMSDVRVLTTTVTTNSPEMTAAIAVATERSICHFGEIMPELAGIEVIMDAQVKPVIVNLYTARAALLGGLLGIILSVFAVLLAGILDTSVYLEADAKRRFGLPVLGSFYKGGDSSALSEELRENLRYMTSGGQMLVPLSDAEEEMAARIAAAAGERVTAARSCLEHPQEYERLREADGVLLLVRCGAHNDRRIFREMEGLDKQGCAVGGVILYDMDRRLERQYEFSLLPPESSKA